MPQNYHTGLTVCDYEITISPRGGVGVESKKIVRARDKFSHESEATYMDYLLEIAINAGLAVAQHKVTGYVKRR